MFLYQATLDLLEQKKFKGTGYIWKSNGVYNSIDKPLYTVFLNIIKLSGCKMRVKSDKNPLAVEQNNYLTEIVNIYMVYVLYD